MPNPENSDGGGLGEPLPLLALLPGGPPPGGTPPSEVLEPASPPPHCLMDQCEEVSTPLDMVQSHLWLANLEISSDCTPNNVNHCTDAKVTPC